MKYIKVALSIDYSEFKVEPVDGFIITKFGWHVMYTRSGLIISAEYSSPKEYFDTLNLQGIPVHSCNTLEVHTQSLVGLPRMCERLSVTHYAGQHFDCVTELYGYATLNIYNCPNLIDFTGAKNFHKRNLMQLTIKDCYKLLLLEGLNVNRETVKSIAGCNRLM